MQKEARGSAAETRSGRWTLARRGAGWELRYEPAKSSEQLCLSLSREQLAAVRALAKREDPAAVRDLLLTPEARAEALSGSAVSSVISANTWRWALPLFGGPPPAGRESAKGDSANGNSAKKAPARRRR